MDGEAGARDSKSDKWRPKHKKRARTAGTKKTEDRVEANGNDRPGGGWNAKRHAVGAENGRGGEGRAGRGGRSAQSGMAARGGRGRAPKRGRRRGKEIQNDSYARREPRRGTADAARSSSVGGADASGARGDPDCGDDGGAMLDIMDQLRKQRAKAIRKASAVSSLESKVADEVKGSVTLTSHSPCHPARMGRFEYDPSRGAYFPAKDGPRRRSSEKVGKSQKTGVSGFPSSLESASAEARQKTPDHPYLTQLLVARSCPSHLRRRRLLSEAAASITAESAGFEPASRRLVVGSRDKSRFEKEEGGDGILRRRRRNLTPAAQDWERRQPVRRGDWFSLLRPLPASPRWALAAEESW